MAQSRKYLASVCGSTDNSLINRDLNGSGTLVLVEPSVEFAVTAVEDD